MKKAKASPFPFELRVASFNTAGEEWAVLSHSVAAHPGASALTAAERDIVAAVVAGRSNAQIARARRTTVRTVANQIATLLRRFEVASRRELIAAVAAGRPPPAAR